MTATENSFTCNAGESECCECIIVFRGESGYSV